MLLLVLSAPRRPRRATAANVTFRYVLLDGDMPGACRAERDAQAAHHHEVGEAEGIQSGVLHVLLQILVLEDLRGDVHHITKSVLPGATHRPNGDAGVQEAVVTNVVPPVGSERVLRVIWQLGEAGIDAGAS